MTLTFAGWVLALLFAAWASFTLALLFIDGRARARDRFRLEIRDWQDKVEAMRRLQDEEGEA
jgi:hypothetical protein